MPDTGQGKYRYPNSSDDADGPLLAQQLGEDIARNVDPAVDAAARTAISSAGKAMEEMRKVQQDTKIEYVYRGAAWVPWNSDWITYTSTLGQASGTFAVGTGGSAEKTTKYKYVSGRVLVYVKFVLGTTGSSMGVTPTFTLPFNAVQLVPQYALLGADLTIHDANLPAQLLQGQVRLSAASQSVAVIYSNSGGTATGVSTTSPMTWAVGDIIVGYFWMDAA